MHDLSGLIRPQVPETSTSGSRHHMPMAALVHYLQEEIRCLVGEMGWVGRRPERQKICHGMCEPYIDLADGFQMPPVLQRFHQAESVVAVREK
jgi:hypothetical protein